MYNQQTLRPMRHGGPPPEHAHFLRTTEQCVSPGGGSSYPTLRGSYSSAPMMDRYMGIPPARVDLVRQRNTNPVIIRDDCNLNTELVVRALPYVEKFLHSANEVLGVGIHPEVIRYIVEVALNPNHPESNFKRQRQLCWATMAFYNDRIRDGEKPEGSPYDATDFREGANLWVTNLIPEVVPIVEDIIRNMIYEDEMRRQSQLRAPSVHDTRSYSDQHVGMFGSTCSPKPRTGFSGDPTEDYTPPQTKASWRSPWEEPQNIVNEPPQGGPKVEDFDRNWMNKIRKYCEERGVEFAPNCLGLIEVDAWCQDFKKQLQRLKDEGKTFLTLEERKKWAHKLPKGEHTLTMDVKEFERLKRPVPLRTKLVIVKSRKEREQSEPKPELVKDTQFEKSKSAEDMGVHTNAAYTEKGNDDTVVTTTTLDRPVVEDIYATEDVQVGIQNVEGEKFLHAIEYDKLVTIPIPTDVMLELRKDILAWHKEMHPQSHGFRKGVGEYLVSLLFEDSEIMDDDHRETLCEFMTKEFNNRSRKTIRSLDNEEKTFEIKDLDELAFTDWDEVGNTYEIPHLKDKMWHVLDAIVNHWILHEKAIVSPEDKHRHHVLLTKESDTLVAGSKFKEDLFLEGTQEEREDFIRAFMSRYTTFRIRNQMLLTNFLKAENEEIIIFPNVEDNENHGEKLYAQALKTLYTGRDLPQLTAITDKQNYPNSVVYERIKFEKIEGDNHLKCFVLKRVN